MFVIFETFDTFNQFFHGMLSVLMGRGSCFMEAVGFIVTLGG